MMLKTERNMEPTTTTTTTTTTNSPSDNDNVTGTHRKCTRVGSGFVSTIAHEQESMMGMTNYWNTAEPDTSGGQAHGRQPEQQQQRHQTTVRARRDHHEQHHVRRRREASRQSRAVSRRQIRMGTFNSFDFQRQRHGQQHGQRHMQQQVQAQVHGQDQSVLVRNRFMSTPVPSLPEEGENETSLAATTTTTTSRSRSPHIEAAAREEQGDGDGDGGQQRNAVGESFRMSTLDMEEQRRLFELFERQNQQQQEQKPEQEQQQQQREQERQQVDDDATLEYCDDSESVYDRHQNHFNHHRHHDQQNYRQYNSSSPTPSYSSSSTPSYSSYSTSSSTPTQVSNSCWNSPQRARNEYPPNQQRTTTTTATSSMYRSPRSYQEAPPPQQERQYTPPSQLYHNENNINVYEQAEEPQQQQEEQVQEEPQQQETEEQEQPVQLIQVSPGVSLPLRRAVETKIAIRCGEVAVTQCMCCQTDLTCSNQDALVICGDCWVFNPVNGGTASSPNATVSIGFTNEHVRDELSLSSTTTNRDVVFCP